MYTDCKPVDSSVCPSSRQSQGTQMLPSKFCWLTTSSERQHHLKGTIWKSQAWMLLVIQTINSANTGCTWNTFWTAASHILFLAVSKVLSIATFTVCLPFSVEISSTPNSQKIWLDCCTWFRFVTAKHHWNYFKHVNINILTHNTAMKYYYKIHLQWSAKACWYLGI